MNTKPAVILIGIALLITAAGTFLFLKKDTLVPSFPSATQPKPSPQEKQRREIMVTNGLRHTVPLGEIISGGVEKGAIPPIENPSFVPVSAADSYLPDDSVGIAVNRHGVQRFYPFSILVWHEIVNDTIQGERVLVTYCPLCFSGIVFDPIVRGERAAFGMSGKLWNSNLVMYDRKTNSLWSQTLGEAIAGDAAGDFLPIIPSDIMRYKTFKKQYPQGQVLSQETGFSRPYGSDPYAEYYKRRPLTLQETRGRAAEILAASP